MAAEILSNDESEAFDWAERERRKADGSGIKLSERKANTAPEVLGLEVGPHRHTGPARSGVTATHNSGRVSVVAMLPVWARAWIYHRATDESAVVNLVADRFGSDDGGDLRLGLASFEVVGEGGEPVSLELLGELHVTNLLALVIQQIGHAPGDAKATITRREALDYIKPSRIRGEAVRIRDHDEKEKERERIAEAWWEAKIHKQPVGIAVAKAIDPKYYTGAAVKAAYVRITDLKDRGVLERVGRESFDRDLPDYLGRGKHGPKGSQREQ